MKIKIALNNGKEYNSLDYFNNSLHDCPNCKNNESIDGEQVICKFIETCAEKEEVCFWEFSGIKNIEIEIESSTNRKFNCRF